MVVNIDQNVMVKEYNTCTMQYRDKVTLLKQGKFITVKIPFEIAIDASHHS